MPECHIQSLETGSCRTCCSRMDASRTHASLMDWLCSGGRHRLHWPAGATTTRSVRAVEKLPALQALLRSSSDSSVSVGVTLGCHDLGRDIFDMP